MGNVTTSRLLIEDGAYIKGSVEVTRQNTIKERFAKDGIEPVGSSAGEFDKVIRSEIAKLTKLVAAANLRIPQ